MLIDGEPSANPRRETAWLSRGLEALLDDRRWMGDPNTEHPEYDFDVVIVGSGYGGAVAAAALSGCVDAQKRKLSVCVLERGKEYLAGSFPSRAADLAGYMRFATRDAMRQRGEFDGLFDMRISEDAVAVVACGLGGGSLINAGVMEMPLEQVFQETRWPQAIRDHAAQIIKQGKQLRSQSLGGEKITSTFDNDMRELDKTAALKSLAESKIDKFVAATITVSNAYRSNAAGVYLDKCLRCGDCAMGCNHNAKDSLDLNLLRVAQQKGAHIFTGATVLRLGPAECAANGWLLYLNHTDSHLRDRQPFPFVLRAAHVILAAGTFGSTEILMRSQCEKLRLSGQLGRKFSANGDMLVTAYDNAVSVNAVANETTEPDPRKPGGGRDIGPTITSMIDLRDGDARTDVVIQDLAVPGPLRRLFEEVTTTYDVLNRLADGDCRTHDGDGARADDAAVNPDAIRNSLVMAMIGRDDAEGELRFGRPICDDADGLLTVSWPTLRQDPRFAAHHERLRTCLLAKSNLGGQVVSNLLWRPLSDKLENLFGRQRGPLLTVHPLGGCAMGEDVFQGVTDYCGRVFNPACSSPKGTHCGLAVMDGSIVPTSLGINPSLTIAVLAQRAITELINEWGAESLEKLPPRHPERRPIFATPKTETQPKPSRFELTEQIRGRVPLRTGPFLATPHWVEITLTTDPVAIADLIAYKATDRRCLTVSPARNGKPAQGGLRILSHGATVDPISDEPDDGDVELEAEISGTMHLFALEASSPFRRSMRAFCAWFVNRGLRDIVQTGIESLQEWWRVRPPPEECKPKSNFPTRIWQRLRGNWDYLLNIWRICSRAGAVRLIEYDLAIDKVIRPAVQSGKSSKLKRHWLDAKPGEPSRRIRGVKRITYMRGSSPWTQTMELSLVAFPRMRKPLFWKEPAALELNKRYLAHKAVPLLRIVEQEDRVSSLTDLLSFGLYALRVVLQVHALTFRKPDPPAARTPQRLPGAVPGLPIPQIDWLTLDHGPNPPVRIRLARYDARLTGRSNAPKRPVLLIHGYSASGTTFVHAAVPGNLTEMLCKEGRDVWVLDMRSSAGLLTATQPWTFEVMAENDIPMAINRVLKITASKKIDVVGHCMGCAMFSMAVLGGTDTRLHEKIGRAVFSQVGPVLILTRSNALAAYIMRYVRHFLPLEDYKFSPEGELSATGQVLDRALSAMSMPIGEYRRENPFWPPGKATPWVGTRHRMDALYARTFSLNNLSDEVLDKIDDFFGPLSIETVSQVIHFATFNTVTNSKGINCYVGHKRLKERFTFPLMSIHGEVNGLVDVATLELMRDALVNSDVEYLNGPCAGASDPTALSQTATEIEMLIDRKAERLCPGRASYITWRIKGHGHQDCLFGKDAGNICGVIAKYLCVPDPRPTQATSPGAPVAVVSAPSPGRSDPAGMGEVG